MLTEEQLQELERCDEYSLRHYQTEISDLVEAYRKQRAQLRELTADAARWLVLNREKATEQRLRDMPATMVPRVAMAAMAHDAALPKIPPAEVC